MNETINQYQKKAVEAIQEYRNELLKEFLLTTKKMCDEFDILCSTGIDKKRYICFEDVEVDQDICYTVLNRDDSLKSQVALQSISNDDNPIERFNEITQKLYEYDEFQEMEDLVMEYMNAKLAEDMIS